MKRVLLALTLAGVIPRATLAQRYQYHLLLDSTVSAARSALLAGGHEAGSTVRRADGLDQRAFTTALPDSNGAPTRVVLHVTMVSRGDTITRIQASADAPGEDSAAVKSAARYFAHQLTAVLGRPASEGEEAGWCWTTRRRFVDMVVDRAYGRVSLALNFAAQNR
jgi:hypothetical protein